MFPFRILPRPCRLTSAVVTMSIAGGLVAGTLAGGALLLASAFGQRRDF